MSDTRIHKLWVLQAGVENTTLREVAASASQVLVRGEDAAAWLTAQGIAGFEQVGADTTLDLAAANWHERLLEKVSSRGGEISVLYVTPIQPPVLDRLAAELAGVADIVEWVNGAALPIGVPPLAAGHLEGALQSLDILALLDKDYPVFSPALPVLIHCEGFATQVNSLYPMFSQVYPADHTIFVINDKTENASQWQEIPLSSLLTLSAPLSTIFITPYAPDASLESFMQVIARLRAPDGCPWDKKQTHASLRPYLLEETYEALEQLDNHNMLGLKEELGDLLLQIALHSQIASENNAFTITQVLQHINRKIVSRHPHVFGEVNAKDDRDVVQNWEKLKELERSANGKEENNGLLDGIPQILPALAQAQSIQERAARVGFDWPEIEPVLAKVHEEMREVSEARDEHERAQELGDLLFAVVNLVRWYKVDAESALRNANKKFRRRFAYIESSAKKASRELQKMTLEEMDVLWEASKALDEY